MYSRLSKASYSARLFLYFSLASAYYLYLAVYSLRRLVSSRLGVLLALSLRVGLSLLSCCCSQRLSLLMAEVLDL